MQDIPESFKPYSEYKGFNLYLEISAVMQLKFEHELIDNNALILYVVLCNFANRYGWKMFSATERKVLAYCNYSHGTFIKARKRLISAKLILHETDRKNAPKYFMVPIYRNIEQFREEIRKYQLK